MFCSCKSCPSTEFDIRVQNDSNEAIPVIRNFGKTTASIYIIPSLNYKLLPKLETFKYNCNETTHLEIQDISSLTAILGLLVNGKITKTM